jgi:predicted anti-sigma-YlaC factor YlaD
MGKKSGPRGDYTFMQDSCGEIRESISASLDGEAPRLAPAEIEMHLAGCDACRRWREAAHEVTRQYRLQAAHAPEPAPAALRSAAVANMPHRRSWVLVVARVALAAVGVAQVIITGKLLLAGDIDSFRDLGALGVALGVGYLVASVRPYRAIGMRPIVATAALLLVGSAGLDLVRHRTTLPDESPHLIAVAGWLLIMFLAWRTPDLGAPPSLLRRWVAQLRRAVDLRSFRPVTNWGGLMHGAAPAFARDEMTTTGLPTSEPTEISAGNDPNIPLTAQVAEDLPRRAVGQ